MQWLAEHAPLIALLFFFFAFLGIAGSVLRPSQKAQIEDKANIPLKGDGRGE